MLLRTLSFLSFSLALLSQSLYAGYDQDHPLFSAYPQARINYGQMIDYEKFTLPISVVNSEVSPETFKPLALTGDLYRHTYEIKNVSSLKVYENYLAAAKKLSFAEIFSCSLNTCGSERDVKTLGGILAISESVYNNYHNPYYWVGEKDSPKGKVVVAWFVGAYEDTVSVQQVVVETESLETGLIKVDAAYAGQAAVSVEALSEEDKAEDNAMLPRYPGARVYGHKKIDTETVKIPFAINATEKTPLQLTGDLTKHTYTVKNVSTLKVFENYKAALTGAGFNFLSQCELEQCGNDKQVNELGDQLALSGDVYNWYHKPYYLLAKKSLPTGNVYIALFIGGYETEVGVQQVIVQEKAVQTGLVNVNADGLKQQIDADGKALIYGIYFDTGKADIKTESKPTLDAIAELLKRNPDLLLYVVGHTDDTGDGAANVTLSKQRADSVVAALVQNYQVAANRLQAQGVGPYAPAGNNTSDAGKQKNRRVELVKRLR